MKILVVEDDKMKSDQIQSFIQSKIAESSITKCFSYQSGLKEILIEIYDLIILDMSMPTFDICPGETGGRSRPFAGKEILRQMRRKGINTPVVIMTQFENFGKLEEAVTLQELKNELEEMYPHTYLGTVYYNAAIDNWKSDLSDILNKLIIGNGEN